MADDKMHGVHMDAALFDEMMAVLNEVTIPVMLPDEFGSRQIGTGTVDADGFVNITIFDDEAINRISTGDILSYSFDNKKDNNNG